MTDSELGSGSKSAKAMLERASGNSLEQSRLLKKYLLANDDRKQALVDMCDPDTLTLIRRFDPEILRGLV